MSKYILAHDLGTTGNKATIYNLKGVLCASETINYPTYYPKSSYVEQDPKDWYKAICESTKRLLKVSKISKEDIACICFSGQMMGCLLVDEKGKPLRNMITWADTRSRKQEQLMIEKLGMEYVYKVTGHRISASYSAAKLLWIRDNEPEVYKLAHKMLQAKDYIVYCLTGNYVTDYSDAGGTNLFDIENKVWSKDIVQKLDIDMSLLPDVRPSTDIVGHVTQKAAMDCSLLTGTPVVIGGGDGTCACVGAGVVDIGSAYNVLGTSSWISSASIKPVFEKDMKTFNWVHLDEKLYTPCGSMQAAGFSYNWFMDTFYKTLCEITGDIDNIHDIIAEDVMQSKPGANGLLYMPYLLGERSPIWNLDARGAFIGLSAMTTKKDMARAVLEGVGYNLKVILEALDPDNKIESITMIGGGAQGKVWLQILADIWGRQLLIPTYLEEATSMGAAVCGGVGIGVFMDFSVMKSFNTIKETVEPNKDNEQIYSKMYAAFNNAYDGLAQTYKELANINDGN